MRLSYVWRLLKKDLALGPRSPLFSFAIILPVALTLVFQVAFGSLFAPQPRLGIVDESDSGITSAIAAIDGIDLTMLDDPEELKTLVEANDLDAGLILPEGFDAALADGEQPLLQFFISGESYAANRIVLSVTALDAVREVKGSVAPVDVSIVSYGEEQLPVSLRLVPIIIFYALAMAGIFTPGSSLVEEKEKGTLMALLVSPVRINEVLVSKWILGVLLSTVMAVVTLLLNGAMGPHPFEVFLVILVAAAMTSMLGLLVGVVAKDSTVLFALTKGSGLILFAPTIFYLFPNWPQWIAMIFPMYWVLEPIWQVSIMGNSITSVLLELGIAIGITVALLAVVIGLARKMRTQMTQS